MLTVCLLIKDEENLLECCLNNIIKFANEIIIVDNGSTDRTRDIIEKYNCKYYYCSDKRIDEARNIYIENSTQPWILTLDADEIITQSHFIMILDTIKNASNSVWGYRLPRFEYYGNGYWATIRILRLFRNKREIYYNKVSIHASVGYSIYENNGIIESLYTPIHHFDIIIPNRTSSKREKYIRLINAEIKKKENELAYKATLCNYLGAEYLAVGNYQEAEKILLLASEKHIKAKGGSYIFLCQCYLKQNKLLLATKYADEVLSMQNIDSNFKERALLVKAQILLTKGKVIEAYEIYKKTLDYNKLAAHHYLNIAHLLYNELNSQELYEIIKIAIQNNAILKEEYIYRKGNTPNIFAHQTSFLYTTPSCIKFINENKFLTDEFGCKNAGYITYKI